MVVIETDFKLIGRFWFGTGTSGGALVNAVMKLRVP